MKHLRYLILTLLAAVAILPAAGKSITLSVSDPHPGVGDYFYVYITVNDIGDRLSGAPGAPGAKQLYFQLKGMQQQTTVINGRSTMSSKATYAVTLRAEKEGKFTYGPVTLGGVRSNTVSYTIGKARPGGKPAPAGQNIGAAPSAPKLVHAGGKDLFLKAVVSEISPYEHQPIVYTIRAYTSYQGTQVNGAPGAPQFENCTYEQTKYASTQWRHENVGGHEYMVADLIRYIVFPSKAGKTLIKGNTFSFSVKQLLEYEDEFGFMPVFPGQTIEAKVPDVTLNVRSLPQHDGDLNGLGNYTVSSTLPHVRLATNQVATITYKIQGTGNLSYMTMPDIASQLPAELKYVKTEDKTDKTVGDSSVSGTVEYTVSFIPLKEGAYDIPELRFTFFDAEKGTYYTRTAPGYHVTVDQRGAAASSDGSGETHKFNPQLQKVGELSAAQHFYVKGFDYWLFYIIPVALLLLAVAVYRRRIKVMADVVGRRSRGASKMARRRLKAAAICMRKGDRPQFYDETLRALWGYIAYKLNMPTSELSRVNVKERLEAAGASEADADRTIEAIDRCEQAKYAPDATADLRADYDAVSSLIDSLERALGRKVTTD